MEFSLFIPLMVAAIQSAGQVLSSAIAKVKDVANKHIFDKTFVENVVSGSNEQLADLLIAVGSNIKQEMREQSVIDVVQDLQADIMVLGRLLDLANTSELSPAIAERLIPNALIPLQKSLEKAQMRLKQYGKDDMSSYCRIVGTSTLIAGYAYLGQSMPALQRDLESSIYKFQTRLLDEIAQMTVEANMKIPWERIPYLVTVDGIADLYALYNSTLLIAEKHSGGKTTEQQEQSTISSDLEILRVQKFGIEVIACPKCGTLNSLALIHCEKCNTNIDNVKPIRNPYLCPKCGALVAPTDQNCPSCRINLVFARDHLDQL